MERGQRGRGGRGGNQASCFNCGKKGHFSRDCFQRKDQSGGSQAGSSRQTANNNSADYPGFVDTHCHVEYLLEKFKTQSFNSVRQKIKASAANFEACISNFCDPASLSPSFGVWRDLLDNNNDVYACFGIHPHQAKNYNDSVEARIEECLQHNKALAWGECGLDYHYNHSPQDVQRDVFRRQAHKAVEKGLPLVVHSRSAVNDTLEILKQSLPREWKIHVHCFTDDASAALDIMQEFPNAYFGFTGVVTYNSSAQIQNAAKIIPNDRIVLESDAPYMVPNGLPGKVSTPGMCFSTAEFLATLKDTGLTELFTSLRENTRALYSI